MLNDDKIDMRSVCPFMNGTVGYDLITMKEFLHHRLIACLSVSQNALSCFSRSPDRLLKHPDDDLSLSSLEYG